MFKRSLLNLITFQCKFTIFALGVNENMTPRSLNFRWRQTRYLETRPETSQSQSTRYPHQPISYEELKLKRHAFPDTRDKLKTKYEKIIHLI